MLIIVQVTYTTESFRCGICLEKHGNNGITPVHATLLMLCFTLLGNDFYVCRFIYCMDGQP